MAASFCMPQGKDSLHVCIIGAGISGLRCADILLQKGLRVTIFEARDRIGGRIHQSDQLGYVADIGPNWIHTSGSNPVLDIANVTQTPLHVWNEKVRVFNRNGIQISGEKAKDLSDLRWELIEQAFPYSTSNKDSIPADASLYDFLVKKTSEVTMDPDDRQLLLDMSQMWGCYIGDSIEKQSLRFAFLEDCCGGEESVVASNFAAILDKLAAPALAKGTILLNHRVVEIENLPSTPPTISVSTSCGSESQFDAVVVTTPLGCLKGDRTTFTPVLPLALSKAFSTISVGHLEKVYINFPRAFWRSEGATNHAPNESQGALEDPYPGYTNWISPNYSKDANPQGWPQEAYDLAAFAPPHSHPTLLFYTFGDLSAHITSAIHSQPYDKQHTFLVSFFKPYYSRLPEYSSTDETCQPKKFLATTWRYDELAGFGSYCNFQVGCEDADDCVERIREGLPERRIWFAGEHAAPVEEMGTVTGAYLSGEGAARRVLKELGMDSL